MVLVLVGQEYSLACRLPVLERGKSGNHACNYELNAKLNFSASETETSERHRKVLAENSEKNVFSYSISHSQSQSN